MEMMTMLFNHIKKIVLLSLFISLMPSTSNAAWYDNLWPSIKNNISTISVAVIGAVAVGLTWFNKSLSLWRKDDEIKQLKEEKRRAEIKAEFGQSDNDSDDELNTDDHLEPSSSRDYKREIETMQDDINGLRIDNQKTGNENTTLKGQKRELEKEKGEIEQKLARETRLRNNYQHKLIAHRNPIHTPLILARTGIKKYARKSRYPAPSANDATKVIIDTAQSKSGDEKQAKGNADIKVANEPTIRSQSAQQSTATQTSESSLISENDVLRKFSPESLIALNLSLTEKVEQWDAAYKKVSEENAGLRNANNALLQRIKPAVKPTTSDASTQDDLTKEERETDKKYIQYVENNLVPYGAKIIKKNKKLKAKNLKLMEENKKLGAIVIATQPTAQTMPMHLRREPSVIYRQLQPVTLPATAIVPTATQTASSQPLPNPMAESYFDVASVSAYFQTHFTQLAEKIRAEIKQTAHKQFDATQIEESTKALEKLREEVCSFPIENDDLHAIYTANFSSTPEIKPDQAYQALERYSIDAKENAQTIHEHLTQNETSEGQYKYKNENRLKEIRQLKYVFRNSVSKSVYDAYLTKKEFKRIKLTDRDALAHEISQEKERLAAIKQQLAKKQESENHDIHEWEEPLIGGRPSNPTVSFTKRLVDVPKSNGNTTAASATATSTPTPPASSVAKALEDRSTASAARPATPTNGLARFMGLFYRKNGTSTDDMPA